MYLTVNTLKLKNQILRVNIKNNMTEKASNESILFEHEMYLRLATLKHQILRINIENNMGKLVMRIYILGKSCT